MTDFYLSDDVFGDMQKLFKNANKYFSTESPLLFNVNYCLLISMWKDDNLFYAEREGLSAAIGNFFSYHNHIGFTNNPLKVLFSGWSDIYEYYLLHKRNNWEYNIRQMEPHYLVGILTYRSIAMDSNLNDSQFWQTFFNSMDPFFSYWAKVDEKIGGNIISNGIVNELNNLFTYDWLINSIKISIDGLDLDYNKRRYYQTLLDNQNNVYLEFKYSYNKLLDDFKSHINNWRSGEFLFKIDN